MIRATLLAMALSATPVLADICAPTIAVPDINARSGVVMESTHTDDEGRNVVTWLKPDGDTFSTVVRGPLTCVVEGTPPGRPE